MDGLAGQSPRYITLIQPSQLVRRFGCEWSIGGPRPALRVDMVHLTAINGCDGMNWRAKARPTLSKQRSCREAGRFRGNRISCDF